MQEFWLDVTEIADQGQEFAFSDLELWLEGFKEYSLPHRVSPEKPLAAKFTIQAEGRGRLIRGRLSGAVLTPCDRCAEAAEVELDSEFELYEEPVSPGAESLEPGLLRLRGKTLELAVGVMLWEQFVLAFPVKPLCEPDCPGLCPTCGRNLSQGPCGCGKSDPDHRFAALRNLKIS